MIGRTRLLVAVACVSFSATGAAGALAGDLDPGDFPKLPDKLIRSKMQTDGVFTVGQQETITVTKMLRKVKVGVTFEPHGSECDANSELPTVCFPVVTRPAPGTRFRTNGHGQATLSFVMPSTYRELRLSDLTFPTVGFTNGQPVEISAHATYRSGQGPKSKLIWSIANASAVVEVPPAP